MMCMCARTLCMEFSVYPFIKCHNGLRIQCERNRIESKVNGAENRVSICVRASYHTEAKERKSESCENNDMCVYQWRWGKNRTISLNIAFNPIESVHNALTRFTIS